MHYSTGSSQDLFLNRKFPVVQQTFLSAFITHIHLFWQILGLGQEQQETVEGKATWGLEEGGGGIASLIEE